MSTLNIDTEFEESSALGASPDSASSTFVILKFGGSSLSSAENWATVCEVLKARRASGLQPVLVLSALRGISAQLEAIVAAPDIDQRRELLDDVVEQHSNIASELGVAGDDLMQEIATELTQLVGRLNDSSAVTPGDQAEVIAFGEHLVTALGAAILEHNGISVEREDARKWLATRIESNRTDAQNYLSAVCEFDFDPALQQHVMNSESILLFQGYVASNADGETVLLGREGSDASAACIAAKIKARRVEIWTDVPGMFSADPRLEPSARLLKELHYDEAQELASTGSRVLHPRSIPPLRADSIPLFIRCTNEPQLQGTAISAATRSQEPQVKGISVRKGITLIAMEGASMWQEVGFLSRAFQVFEAHRISVDLVSTSESSVTVSIDMDDSVLSDAQISALIADLQIICKVRLVENCAAITVVGRRMRAFLAKLAPALSIFEEQRIHMVSQAANDLNFSLVIDQDQVPRVLGKLHSMLIGSAGSDVFGPAWAEPSAIDELSGSFERPWWLRRKEELLELATKQICAYVYDMDSVKSAAKAMRKVASADRLLYAVKANCNPQLIRAIADEGVDFDCVSPAEVEHIRRVVPGISNDRILLTLNFAPRAEYEWAVAKGLQITLDNLFPLQQWPEIFEDQQLFIRLDPGQGFGHHDHVKTAGAQSKFGIPKSEIDELERLLQIANAQVVGIHAHSGSGILDPGAWRTVADELVAVASRFPEAKILDLGGGFGVPEKTGDTAFDLEQLDQLLAEFKSDFPGYQLWLEPGRFLVSGAGVLLTRVTQTKGKGDRRYVGVGAGMNSLIRPALYGAYHDIINLTRYQEPATSVATVVGPICETGDKLGIDRLLPDCRENDVIVIANAGAYGQVMGSRYNLREIAPEIVL